MLLTNERGSFSYEMGDHGGLMVMADNIKVTNKVIYSWDEGLSWEEFKFSEDAINVKNIVIEPDNIDNTFYLYGIKEKDGRKTEAILVTIDFSTLHPRICNG
jgi:hypothetical protein